MYISSVPVEVAATRICEYPGCGENTISRIADGVVRVWISRLDRFVSMRKDGIGHNRCSGPSPNRIVPRINCTGGKKDDQNIIARILTFHHL